MELNRLSAFQSFIDEMLSEVSDADERRAGTKHLYAVSEFAAMLAKKRGLDPELAAIAGLFHDYATYRTGTHEDHEKKGALIVFKELVHIELTSPEENEIICTAIGRHGDKANVHEPMDEVLKDADVLSHVFYNVTKPVKPHEQARFEKLSEELGLLN